MDGPDHTTSTTTGTPAPTTYYVDFAKFEGAMLPEGKRPTCTAAQGQRSRRPRFVTTIDDETKAVRRNVRDSTHAVLTWVAAVVDHDHDIDLDQVLDRCLRPGGDVQNVNYAAIAREVSRHMGVELTPKQVRTAIAHIRSAGQSREKSMAEPTVKQRLDALHARLESHYNALVSTDADGDQEQTCRALAVDVLSAVRRAASRLIDTDFGEGIPREIDVDELEGRFLDFVREVSTGDVGQDLHRLLVALCDYDGSAESDMRLVVTGARAVGYVSGPASLPGLIARLNLLVAGRHLLDTPAYCDEMSRLADLVVALHDDADTKRFMNWVRRLPEEQRLPSPIRVASYCLNNATTHVLERVFRDELDDALVDTDEWLTRADEWWNTMRRRDAGFILVKTTQLLLLAVEAASSGDTSDIEAHFTQLGRDKSIALLKDLARFESCDELVRAVQQHAAAAMPEVAHQIIRM